MSFHSELPLLVWSWKGWEDGVWSCGAGDCAGISPEAEGRATPGSLDGCGAAIESSLLYHSAAPEFLEIRLVCHRFVLLPLLLLRHFPLPT